jgi:hypothetical protein
VDINTTNIKNSTICYLILWVTFDDNNEKM